MKIRFLLAAMLMTASLAACAHRTEAPDFYQELGKQYLNQSWSDRDYFTAKGRQALKGTAVQPEALENWSLPWEQRPALIHAYDRLQIALVPDGKKQTSPIHAARAQVAYDCWVEQAHLRMGSGPHRKDCRAVFYQEFCAMYPGKCVKPEQLANLYSDLFRVYFATGSARLDAKSRQTIADAVAAYSESGNEILLGGHADSSGDAKANLKLSKARAAAVRKLLNEYGVPATAIHENYFGEYQPLKNAPEADQRRVLIVVR